ncbi:copper chaperone PCu(A)C [Nocardioides daphniae]|uniref:Copper chaperone PCu(A)C n=1 Tax=Nocardioides daphniae TaxID=402297 RepID=A0A4P7UCH7_9ACTN|nr:copper chaperone PCu(A)C [Nocardioides daphniae]QCC77860.1 copper chaperone PCu(A)C [Nocardioides daphniae]GGD27642.1 hypothetical protein GCM10007231_28880 [Nocardioides daphniae]
MSHTRSPLNRARLGAAALVVALAGSVAACGTDTGEKGASSKAAAPAAASADALVVEDPWVRGTDGAKDATMSAAFMVLDNEGDEEFTLTGATTDAAARVELHEMAMVDGKSVMREIDGGIVLAPGKGQLLQPGGLHIMLMDLTGGLAAGDEVTLTLELADGSTKEVTAPVKAFTEEEEHYHAPGTADHEH